MHPQGTGSRVDHLILEFAIWDLLTRDDIFYTGIKLIKASELIGFIYLNSKSSLDKVLFENAWNINQFLIEVWDIRPIGFHWKMVDTTNDWLKNFGASIVTWNGTTLIDRE